jgi:hypothetical protein
MRALTAKFAVLAAVGACLAACATSQQHMTLASATGGSPAADVVPAAGVVENPNLPPWPSVPTPTITAQVPND